MKKFVSLMMTLILMLTFAVGISAADGVSADGAVSVEDVASNEHDALSTKAIAAAIVVSVVGAVGAFGMAMAISKSAESMARQPEMAGKINSAMMLGLVFIETAIIYALIVAILIIFVL